MITLLKVFANKDWLGKYCSGFAFRFHWRLISCITGIQRRQLPVLAMIISSDRYDEAEPWTVFGIYEHNTASVGYVSPSMLVADHLQSSLYLAKLLTGYDFLQCRLRGRLDTNGCVAAYLEERLNLGVNFLLSAEVGHFLRLLSLPFVFEIASSRFH